ncbi:hypothetical protein T261_0732 [Streptomyces lydicus]|nr:hypothetical protein T261_0732 [Streptomyces lydicus]
MMNQNEDIRKRLETRVKEVPHLRGAVIASVDGLLRYMSGFTYLPSPGNDAHKDCTAGEKRAAMASTLANLANQVSAFEGTGSAMNTIIESERGFCVVGVAGQRTVIAFYADANADLGQVGYELARLSKQLAGPLDLEYRTAGVA